MTRRSCQVFTDSMHSPEDAQWSLTLPCKCSCFDVLVFSVCLLERGKKVLASKLPGNYVSQREEELPTMKQVHEQRLLPRHSPMTKSITRECSQDAYLKVFCSPWVLQHKGKLYLKQMSSCTVLRERGWQGFLITARTTQMNPKVIKAFTGCL